MPTPKRLTMLCAALVAQLVIGSTTASESPPAAAGGCEAEASKLNTTEWLAMPSKHCFAHRLPAGAACPTRYASQAIAQSECLLSASCGGVYTPLGRGAFFLCDAQHPLQESAEGGTVLRKTPAAAQAQATSASTAVGTRRPGQAQAGKWCSNSCCCTQGYHGEACDDVDECASAPCRNDGACDESSSSYLVNDYFRKYRCDCAKGLDGKPLYRGHDCGVKKDAAAPGAKSCLLQLGADSASGSTSTLKAYKQFQMALEFTGITLKSSDTDFEGLCTDVYEHHQHGGVCGQQFVLRNKAGAVIATPTVNCMSKTTGKPLPELFAVMSLCATPCMQDPASKCCFVPAEVAWMFPCCRELGCCAGLQNLGAENEF